MGSRALTITGAKGVLDSGRGARDCTDIYELHTHTHINTHTHKTAVHRAQLAANSARFA